jgi:hypothetical protein
MSDIVSRAAFAAQSDLPEAGLERRLQRRLAVLEALTERDPQGARAIALRLIRALHDLTGIAVRPPVARLMAAMDRALRGDIPWEVVERVHRLDATFYFNATMFGGKGYASALVCHLASHLSARRPNFRYVADGALRLLERRNPVERDDIQVGFSRAAALHALLAAVSQPELQGEAPVGGSGS